MPNRFAIITICFALCFLNVRKQKAWLTKVTLKTTSSEEDVKRIRAECVRNPNELLAAVRSWMYHKDDPQC
jgi:hypothetical protein